MIRSFNCADTEHLYTSGKSKRFANIRSAAERKPQQLDSAATLEFLKSPPGKHLEDYLAPLGLTPHALAKALHVTPARINDVVREVRGITPDIALRLARFFGGEALLEAHAQQPLLSRSRNECAPRVASG